MSTDEQQKLLALLIEVDERATGLDSDQIEFVADLIDRDVTEFTVAQGRAIRVLHRRHVKRKSVSDDTDELD